jgi:hypothetical protein
VASFGGGPPDGGEVDDAEDDDYHQMQEALHRHVSDFADEHDLTLGAVSVLLIDLAVTWRMLDYVMSVEKPSGAGLKLDLDRMRRDVEEHLRNCKRGADDFIVETRDIVRESREVDTGEDPAAS